MKDSLRFLGQVFRAIFETRELAQETQRHITDRTVFPAQWDPKLGIHVT